MVFSVLAYAGHKKQEEADTAFSEAVKVINLFDLSILDKSDISLTKFDKGLDNLLLLKPLLKRDFLKACLASAMTDNKMTAREIELIRAIADTLNCPIPPISSDE